MSRDLALLRGVDPRIPGMQRLQQSLRRCGVDVHMGTPPPSIYLRFQLTSAAGTLICYVEANGWAAVHLPNLVGLDWASMDPLVMAGLTAVERPLQFAHVALAYGQAHVLPTTTPLPSDCTLPAVPAAEGAVWIETWAAPLPPASLPLRLPAGLAIPLRLQLGSVVVSLHQLRRLRGGDIALLATSASRAWRGRCPVFDFQLQTDSLLVTTVHIPASPDLEMFDSRLQPDDPLLEAVGLEDLPLELHVLLCHMEVSLGELAGMQEGSVLTLPDRTSERVQLMHNGRRLAVGELVQVGDRLGVKIAQGPRLT